MKSGDILWRIAWGFRRRADRRTEQHDEQRQAFSKFYEASFFHGVLIARCLFKRFLIKGSQGDSRVQVDGDELVVLQIPRGSVWLVQSISAVRATAHSSIAAPARRMPYGGRKHPVGGFAAVRRFGTVPIYKTTTGVHFFPKLGNRGENVPIGTYCIPFR